MPLYGKIVIIKRNGQDGTTFPLMAQLCLFGRSTTCDIRVQLPNISKEHCAIIVGEDGAVSVNAYNRTLINGIPVNGRADIGHKDIMTISDRSFRFEYPPNSVHLKTQISTPIRPTSSYLLGPSLETPKDEATPKPPASAGRTPRPKLLAVSAKRKSGGASLLNKTPNANLKRAATSLKLKTPITSTKRAKIIKSPNSTAVKKYQSRKNVSFGPYLSPEQFDLKLPANTPIRKGTTPRRISEPPKYFGSPIVLSKFPAQNRNRFSVAATIAEEPLTPEKNSPTQKIVTPRFSTPFFKIKSLTPKKNTTSTKAKSPSPKAKSPSPKAKSPSPKAKSPSPKAKSLKKRTMSPNTKSSPKVKSPKKRTLSPKAKSLSPKVKTPSPIVKSSSPKKKRTPPQGKSPFPNIKSPTKPKAPLKSKSTPKLPSPAKILYSKKNYPSPSSPLQTANMKQQSSFIVSSPTGSDILYLSSSDTSLVGSTARLQKRLSHSPKNNPQKYYSQRRSVSNKESIEKQSTPDGKRSLPFKKTPIQPKVELATGTMLKTPKIPTPASPDSKKIKALAAIHASKLKKTPKSVKKTPKSVKKPLKLKVLSVKKGIKSNLFSEVLKKGLAKRTPRATKKLVSLNVAQKKKVVKKTPGRKLKALKANTSHHANSPETIIISKKTGSPSKSSIDNKSYNISTFASPSNITTDVFVSPLESGVKGKGRSKGIMMARFMKQHDKNPHGRTRKSGIGYLDPSGVKQLLKSPQKSPKADYSNVSGIKQLFAKSSSDYFDVDGVKELLRTPSKNQISTYERVEGVKALLYRAKDTGTPKVNKPGIRKSSVKDLLSLPNTSLGDLEIAQLFSSPEKSQSPPNMQSPPKHFTNFSRRKSSNIGSSVLRPVGIATQIRNTPLSSLTKSKDDTSAINRTRGKSLNSSLTTQKHEDEKNQYNTIVPRKHAKSLSPIFYDESTSSHPRKSVRKNRSLSTSKLDEMLNLPSPNKSFRRLRSISPRKTPSRTQSFGTSSSKHIHVESRKVLDDVVSQVTSIVSPRGRSSKLPESLTKNQSLKRSHGRIVKSPKASSISGDKNVNFETSPRKSLTTAGDSSVIITQNSDPHELLDTAKASTTSKLVVFYLVSPEMLQSNATPKSSEKLTSPWLSSTAKLSSSQRNSIHSSPDKTISIKKGRKARMSNLKEATSTPIQKEQVAFHSSVSPVSKERSAPKRKMEINNFSTPERSASKTRSPSPKKTRSTVLSKQDTIKSEIPARKGRSRTALPKPTAATPIKITEDGKERKSSEPSPLKTPSPVKKTRGRKKLINESKADNSLKLETLQVMSPPVKRGRGRARKIVNESKADDSVKSKQETPQVPSPPVKKSRGRGRKTVNDSKADESATAKEGTPQIPTPPVKRGRVGLRKTVVSPARGLSISKELSNIVSENKSPKHEEKGSPVRSTRGKRVMNESLKSTASPVRKGRGVTSPKKTLSPKKPIKGRRGTKANKSVEICHPEQLSPFPLSSKQQAKKEKVIATPKKSPSPKKMLRGRQSARRKMSDENEESSQQSPKYQSPARDWPLSPKKSPTPKKLSRRGGKAISSPKEPHPSKRVRFSPKTKSPITRGVSRGRRAVKAVSYQEEAEPIIESPSKISPKTSPSPIKNGQRQTALTKTPSPSPKKTRSRRGVSKAVVETTIKPPSPVKRKRATTSKIEKSSAKKLKTGKGLAMDENKKTDDYLDESSDVLDKLRKVKVKKPVKKNVIKKKSKKNTKLSIIAEVSNLESTEVKGSSPGKKSPPKRNLRSSRRIKK